MYYYVQSSLPSRHASFSYIHSFIHSLIAIKVVRAMDQWSTFQDIFKAEFIDGNGVVEVGQKIRITTAFPVLPQVTLERYDDLVENERLCWTVEGFELIGIKIPSPNFVLKTARCIELSDDESGGTRVDNWISYAGLGWPAVCLFTGAITTDLFNDFNAELAAQF